MIVCLCTGLTEHSLAMHIALGLTDPIALMRKTRAGRCSFACRAEIVRLVRELSASCQANDPCLAEENRA